MWKKTNYVDIVEFLIFKTYFLMFAQTTTPQDTTWAHRRATRGLTGARSLKETMEKRGATVEMVAMEGMIAMEMITTEMSPVEVTTVKMTTVEVIATAMIMMAVRGDAAPIARGTVNMTATTALVGIAAGAAVAVAVMARVIMENMGTNKGIVMGAEALAVVMVTVVVVVAGVGVAMGLQNNAVNPGETQVQQEPEPVICG